MRALATHWASLLDLAERRGSQGPVWFAAAYNAEINSSIEQAMQDFVRFEVLERDCQVRVRGRKTRQAW